MVKEQLENEPVHVAPPGEAVIVAVSKLVSVELFQKTKTVDPVTDALKDVGGEGGVPIA